MIKIIARMSMWFSLFFVSIDKLGFLNSIKIFLNARFSDKKLQIILPSHMPFVFRGKLDRGVLSHFYKEGYFIDDNSGVPIKTILDAGANIGDETARFSIHYPQSSIVAIEASESNYEILHENFKDNDRVELFKGALWPIKAHLKVVPGNTMEAFSVIETSDVLDSVPGYTILELMKKMEWDKIDILKLDVEGSEYDLFTRNFSEWIDKVNAFVFEVPDNDRPGSTQAIYRALKERNYNSYICGENLVLIRSDLTWKLRKVIGFHI